MNGVEAAASLFGPDDASSDPFASLGADAVASPTGDVFRDYGAPLAEVEDPFAMPNGSSNKVQTLLPEESLSHRNMPTQHDSFQVTDHYGSSGVVGQQSQNWYGTEGHGSVTVQQSHPSNDSYWPAYSATSESSKPPPSQNAYGPYNPSPAGNAYMSTYTPSLSSTDYAPYNPSAPVAQPSVAQNGSPYAPSTSGQYSTQTSPSYRSLPPANVRPPSSLAPPVSLTRPKISNAYDPPFPPVAKSKRVASRSGLNQSVTAAYGSYPAAYSSQDTSFTHGQAHPIVPPFGGQKEYGSYSNDIHSVGNMRHEVPPVQDYRATDSHQEQDTTFDSASWNTKMNGYHPQGKVVQPDQFMSTAQGAKTWYPTGPSASIDNNMTQMNDYYSSDVFSRHEVESKNRNGLQAEAMHQTVPPKASILPDFGVARASPEMLTDYSPRSPQSFRTAVPSQGYASKSPEPYGPPKANHYAINTEECRAASPGSQSVRSMNGRQNTIKPPVAGRPPSRIENTRGRSSSNSSLLGPSYPEGAYAPPLYSMAHLPVAETGMQNPTLGNPPIYPTYGSPAAPLQEVPIKLQPQYAPSPSLIGSNDPLGRTSARVPVISFGFGGKIVTCFHGLTTLNTGFDVALSSRKTADVQIYNLTKVIPRSALDIPATSFPGPLFSDPGTITSSLVRTGAASQKNKKTAIVKYLTERAEEITHGLGYLSPGSPEKRQAEGKLILVKLLRVMVENDGRLSGSPSIDASVRMALVPRLDGALTSPTPEFTTMADTQVTRPDIASVLDPETVIAVSTLRSSSLDKIQEFLLRGERRQAYCYALDEKLWAHAMIIASSIDKDAWKEVVNEFLKAELGVKDEGVHGRSYLKIKEALPSSTNGREGLRAAYSLFSGQGSVAIQELVPQNAPGRGMAKLQTVPPAHLTPRTPNFQPPAPPANIPPETLAKWAEIVAMMFSSTISTDTSSALTALGDQLLANQYVEAAHACYLVAPQTSLMGGLGNPAVRIVLVGSKTPTLVPNLAADLDPIIFSEIVEFALSLSPAGKGQDAFAGLPHLQAFKFFRAVSLAEVGEMQLASRYCEAITASLGRSSPYFTQPLLEQLKGLMDRISGTSHVDKTGSWMGSKIGKPSLDSIGGWLEGRIAKFVAGDVDSPTQPQDMTKVEERTFSGPFSTISSTTPSARSSPQPTLVNNVVPPPRSGSAMAFPSQHTYVPVDRASSALDHYKPKVTSTPRVASASVAVTSFSQPPMQGPNVDNQPQNTLSPGADTLTPKMTNDENIGDQGEPAWWGSLSSYDNSAKTPTATSFMRIEESVVRTTSEGFISLMDAPTFSNITSNTARESPPHSHPIPEEEDMEDLGFGNTRKERKITDNNDATGPSQPAELQNIAEPSNTEPNPPTASSGSWLSRWWSREQTTGPVKASLGQESAFYYDKELKRWVNKKAGSENTATKPVLPPPPSRAQTASPGMTGPRSTATKPPSTQTHSTSAIDLSTSPPSKSTLSVQSNLAPPVPDSAPSTPTGMRLSAGGPPPSRPVSQTSTRRNLRSRYVDILQSEGRSS